ncbi:hypothetical protein M1M30_gp013 [Maribacter phage Colly_1]|uniref:Uncharacterized protein n=1 Tax=Maribacter phage Colly_1 TaxID=2745691 RepID=A0A8E4UXU2_9CAUD|nr:hypothetical protein M1M30_gp013 [Maribacter phage Colly_1]QQO97229.1 hypothetical protein Colly1_13 [Maribacter phage Colly_1]
MYTIKELQFVLLFEVFTFDDMDNWQAAVHSLFNLFPKLYSTDEVDAIFMLAQEKYDSLIYTLDE